MTSTEIMLALAKLPEAKFMSHDRKNGDDLVYSGKLYANETGWVFPDGPGGPKVSGTLTTAWLVVSEDPLVAGLRTRDVDQLFASRLPEGNEYEEWLKALAAAAPAELSE